MATIKVKVLKNHHIGRIRAVGTTYLVDELKVPFLVKQGYIEVVKSKKRRNESTNGDSK